MIDNRIKSATAASRTSKSIGYSSIKSAIMPTPWVKLKKGLPTLSRCLLISFILLGACSSPHPPVNLQKEVDISKTPSHIPKYTSAQYVLSSWESLPNWKKDQLTEAWPAWLKSCQYAEKAKDGLLQGVCKDANQVNLSSNTSIQHYFESQFNVWEIRQARDISSYPKGSNQGLITAYYEPILQGALKRGGIYQTPLYRMPPAWQASPQEIRAPRTELLRSHVLDGFELVWVADPIAAAFMQIQGSGRILLENNQELRLGFGGSNNQPYVSIGKWLIDQKELTPAQASKQGISDWAMQHPRKIDALLNANPRFVFFKILAGNVKVLDGPIGSIGVSLTAQRSIAVDLQSIPKGAPVFLATTDPETKKPIERLVFAQDTGAAIVGGVRADYYWGSGEMAGEKAGKMKQTGRMWVLLPKVEGP